MVATLSFSFTATLALHVCGRQSVDRWMMTISGELSIASSSAGICCIFSNRTSSIRAFSSSRTPNWMVERTIFPDPSDTFELSTVFPTSYGI
ncbi:hypothetical protein BLNAU_21011 [Blattamonas nauphoetae]|uniref:Secreted protein n=1 Tax=Blattamonas nauphoetae TaxID=2049346 RepID=A0ABQ9WX53_9EUKA|nr:hypothetical protein BLNAU_21011 [Blattamonas nauphoetae]